MTSNSGRNAVPSVDRRLGRNERAACDDKNETEGDLSKQRTESINKGWMRRTHGSSRRKRCGQREVVADETAERKRSWQIAMLNRHYATAHRIAERRV